MMRPSGAYGRLAVAAAERRGALMSSPGVSADTLGANVGDVDRDVVEQPALEGDVPGVDGAAIDVVDLGRVFGGRAVERHAAAN